MKVTVDRVGRIVIPKPLRDAVGIAPDSELEMVVDGTGIRCEVVDRRRRTIDAPDGFPRLRATADAPRLTDSDIRELRDRDQR
jgi:AbrB family looped-hinge helix DNA binding protein